MIIESQHLLNSHILQGLELRVVGFEEVFPVWSERLWPNRASPIRPVSPIQVNLQYDASILQYPPFFFGLYRHQKLIGTISGYQTNETLFRSRGLYLDPLVRGNNLSQILFTAVTERALMLGLSEIWTLPRKSSWHAYERFGFYRESDWFSEGMEYGPNCLAKYSLNQRKQN